MIGAIGSPAMDFMALAQECAPQVHPTTLAAVVHVESGFNPFAIGVVGGRLVRQPKNIGEAVATARALEAGGWNFSVGAGQVNRYNLARFGLTYETAFDACKNLRAGATILKECYDRAAVQTGRFATQQAALEAALSCYYSGNFTTGLKPDFKGQPSYVDKVLASAGAIPVVAATKSKRDSRTANNEQPTASDAKPTADDSAVVLQPATRKASKKGSRYDGFAAHSDEPANPYDGFAQQQQD